MNWKGKINQMERTDVDNEKLKLTIITQDEQELIDYLKAKDMKAFIVDLEENLRNLSRRGFPSEVKSPDDAVNHIKDLFFQLKYDYLETFMGDF